jgi:hypothetical protein
MVGFDVSLELGDSLADLCHEGQGEEGREEGDEERRWKSFQGWVLLEGILLSTSALPESRNRRISDPRYEGQRAVELEAEGTLRALWQY